MSTRIEWQDKLIIKINCHRSRQPQLILCIPISHATRHSCFVLLNFALNQAMRSRDSYENYTSHEDKSISKRLKYRVTGYDRSFKRSIFNLSLFFLSFFPLSIKSILIHPYYDPYYFLRKSILSIRSDPTSIPCYTII